MWAFTFHDEAKGVPDAAAAIAGATDILVERISEDPALRAAVRRALREKGTPYAELKLDDPSLSDDDLLDAMIAHPILIQRPLVVTPNGVRLCRPSELVLDLLPPQRGEFFKEDGEQVIDASGGWQIAGG